MKPEAFPREKVFFVGIGGVGMSGLAQILLSRGMHVAGSDPTRNEATQRLQSLGARIYERQAAENIEAESPDLVVMTAAVNVSHPEIEAALKSRTPVISRADLLGKLMSESAGPRIAVTGTHGKTTTTSMIAAILMRAGLNPTVLVGGEFDTIGGNVRVGGDIFLTEACEAYDSFLSLAPDIAVITNLEADHLDYYGTEERIHQSFAKFINRIRDDGLVVWCSDDLGMARLMDKFTARDRLRRVSYGIDGDPEAEYRARIIEESERLTAFDVLEVRATSATLGTAELYVPGRHNVLNALAAIAVGLELGVPFDLIASALSSFRGARRRFQLRGEREGVAVIDDYAHHPTEVRATIRAARVAFPDRRIIALFQPHLFSRTRDFRDEFASALSGADAVLVTDIYAAREKPIAGVHSSDLIRSLAKLNPEKTLMYVPSKERAIAVLDWIARPGDVILTMGAGDVNEIADELVSNRLRAA